MAVSVKLLGGFEATVDGVVVPDSTWRLKKARELVKLLALARGHRLHRDQALDVLWRELAPAAAANNLHQAVHVARRALGADTIDVRDEVLSLAEDVDVDVDLLELGAADARRMKTAAAYRAVLALYRGELLPENRYDDWAEGRREELAELAAALAEESAALGTTAPFSLPADTSSFVGRARELSELDSLLRHTRVLTLSGAGGVGKTRLALQLARSVEPSYESGAALVELAAVSDPRLVTDAIATALDVRPLPAQELIAAVIDFLAARELLLVLDNCEHLLSATAALTDALLRAAPQLTILATSRESLRVPGEVIFRVPSLAIPDPERPLPPHELLDYASVSLFVARAVAASPSFELDEQNAEDVARICLRLDGLPLALELAAARLGALSPAAIAARLDDRFRLLRSGSHAAPTRQQTLTATLQWSHDLLEPDEQLLLRRLAVFAGGFELEASEEVCAGDGLESMAIADTLARLVEKSLVTVEDGGGRYRLLETVRMYARGRLEEAGEADVLAGRHARWALALAQRRRTSPKLDRDTANLRVALDLLLARDPPAALALCVALSPFWLRRIELEEARRRFAVALAAAPELTPLRAEALLAAAAIDFRAGTLARVLELAEESHAAALAIGDARSQWRALQFLGEVGVAGDDIDVAIPALEQGLALARSEKFAPAEALGIHSLGVVRWMRGDLANADRLLAESVEAFRALEASSETVPSPLNIAEIRTSLPGSRPGLQHVFEDTLKPFVEISCEAATSYALANLAGNARARGYTAEASALLEESADRFAAAGDDTGLATVSVRRAYAAFLANDLTTARKQLEVALDLRTTLGDRRGRGLVISGLGMVATVAGDYDTAERHLASARDIFRRAGDRWGLASSLWWTADLAVARNDLESAEAALQEAFAVLGETQRERWIANTLSGLAEVALLRGDVDQASFYFMDARNRYAARDDALGTAHIDERLAQLAK